MRTLNRPMFRYGGPIKQGVMNGIREPKKNGGSMSKQFNTGLVGDERYPKTDGREHHFAFLAPMAAAALRFAPAAYRGFKANRAYTPFSKNLGIGGRLKDMFMPKKGTRILMGDRGEGAGFATGALLRSNPLTSLSLLPQAAAGTYAVGSGIAKGVPGALKGYIDALVPGDSIFKQDGDKNEKETLEKLTTESIKEVLTPAEEKALAASKKATAEAAKIASASFAKAEKEKRLEGYREIMNIKGMNKDATYKSLIDASTAIQNEGDFKGSIKDGSLINKLIRSTSKNFDKVTDTKKAINSLILKGEIEKDINQGKDGSQMKAAKDFAAAQGISVTEAYKSLGFSKNKNLSENIAIVSKSQGGIGLTTDSVTEGIRMTYPELGVPQVVFTDAELIDQKKKNPLYKNANEAAIFEDFAVKNELGNGVYVLGTTAFTLTDGKLEQLR